MDPSDRISKEELPIIDIGALVQQDASPAARAEVAKQLHQACLNVGFFIATNHGVPQELCERALALSRRWFELPEEVKAQIEIEGEATHYRGYQRLGANVTRYELPGGGAAFQRDHHEAIDLFREAPPASSSSSSSPAAAAAAGEGAVEAAGEGAAASKGPAAGSLTPSPIHGPNPWPTHVDGIEACLKEYVACMLRLGSQIMAGIAEGLGVSPSDLMGDHAGAATSYWIMRLIHYPPLQASSEAVSGVEGAEVQRSVQLSCGEHSDYGLLTLVNQEQGVVALQVRSRDGSWINVVPKPNTFVVNIGDMLTVYTNGLYTATRHRVINTSARSRVSIPFFYEPGFDTVVAPLPGLLKGQPQQHRPIRYGAHLDGKVLTNFEL